uniref:hypothetical protein n=1 Tax=Collinsella sp. D33t1_170424_A12 TaxID=2787135 RepID=UPI001898A64A
PYEDVERLHDLSLEWAIFDRPLEGGLTGVEMYCEENPDRRGNGYLSQLREAEKCQFSSMFSVERIDIAAHRLELQDAFTGNTFQVRDYSLSEGLFRQGGKGSCGVIVARLAKSGGEWFFPGNVVAFYPVVIADHMKEVLREEGGERPSFLELARQTYGPRGGVASGSLEAQFPDVDFEDPEQLAVFRVQLADRYRELADRFALKATWESVVFDIAHEDGKIMPTELMKRSLGDLEETCVSTMEDLNEILGVWMAAWNVMPHNALGGRAPAEL